jgi:hypothetical protein
MIAGAAKARSLLVFMLADAAANITECRTIVELSN